MELPKNLQNLNQEEFEGLVRIGFCQPKFYKRSVWLKAKKLMDELVCPAGLAKPFDFGKGKGKFSSDLSISEVIEKGWDIYQRAIA